MDVIAKTAFGIDVNSQNDQDSEFVKNATNIHNVKMTNPFLLCASTSIVYNIDTNCIDMHIKNIVYIYIHLCYSTMAVTYMDIHVFQMLTLQSKYTPGSIHIHMYVCLCVQIYSM